MYTLCKFYLFYFFYSTICTGCGSSTLIKDHDDDDDVPPGEHLGENLNVATESVMPTS